MGEKYETGNKKSDKEIWKPINKIRKQYGMSEYSFHEDVKQMQYHFKKNIDSFTAQNHFDGTYTKKSLSQRWNDFNGIKIQRDLYSAFLIMNMSEDLKNFDIEKCNKRFENFYRLHNLEVDRLTGRKNLSSIAI